MSKLLIFYLSVSSALLLCLCLVGWIFQVEAVSIALIWFVIELIFTGLLLTSSSKT